MRVVIDTNILLISLPKISKYRPIFDGLLSGIYELIISNSIYAEYIEIIGRKTTDSIAQNLAELLDQLGNVEKTDIFFSWNLITSDPDDNKFVDCAISANANYLVTNDNHFKVLKEIDFPSVEVIDADSFLEIIRKMD